METAETGCVRSTLFEKGKGGFDVRLDLVLLNGAAMRRLGATYGEGLAKYGVTNWMKGFEESVYLAHAVEHLLAYLSGKSTEDDLAHACWNLMTLMWVQENKPELLNLSKEICNVANPKMEVKPNGLRYYNPGSDGNCVECKCSRPFHNLVNLACPMQRIFTAAQSGGHTCIRCGWDKASHQLDTFTCPANDKV